MQKNDPAYKQALDYIYSFIDYSLTRDLRFSPDKFDLRRMFKFMELLGNPQKDYRIIHVAGTKGKGSTCAMLSSVLSQAGYKTGFYSSPHLIEFTERFQIGGHPITKDKIVEYVNRIKPYIDRVENLTTFEIITGIALKYFSEEKVDFAILEVGMGGRLDATNVVDPILTVITSISKDHMKVLGPTIDKIAHEKAGIIKAGIPVVFSPQNKRAKDAIIEVALKKGSPIIDVKEQLSLVRKSFSLEGQYFQVKEEKTKPVKGSFPGLLKKDIYLPLLGDFQLDNAATAITCLAILKEMGFEVSVEDIIRGFTHLYWPGRFEIISSQPLVIIDGAHNYDSFRKLKATIDMYLNNKEIILIFGVSEDKEIKRMLTIINPSIDHLIITQAKHPRALDIKSIEKCAKKIGINYTTANSVEDSFRIAMGESREQSAIIAAGSIFIAGEVRKLCPPIQERNSS